MKDCFMDEVCQEMAKKQESKIQNVSLIGFGWLREVISKCFREVRK
jgi:hypothetical protein